MLSTGVSAADITRLGLTQFHGDHCLGVPGVVQRLSLDRVLHTVTAHYPASGAEHFRLLRHASPFHEVADLHEEPVHQDRPIAKTPRRHAGGTRPRPPRPDFRLPPGRTRRQARAPRPAVPARHHRPPGRPAPARRRRVRRRPHHPTRRRQRTPGGPTLRLHHGHPPLRRGLRAGRRRRPARHRVHVPRPRPGRRPPAPHRRPSSSRGRRVRRAHVPVPRRSRS